MPFDYHRFIIGGKGKDVRKMMQEYDVNISIPPPSEHSDLVRVSGPPENVERARKALEQKVAQLDAEKEDRVRKQHCPFGGLGGIVVLFISNSVATPTLPHLTHRPDITVPVDWA